MKYATALLKNDEVKEAEPVLRECMSIREKTREKDDWRIAEVRRVLAECLTKLTQFAEAEALVIELANAMHQQLIETRASDKAEATQRVVDLYEAWDTAEPGKGYDAKAAEWRTRIAGEGGRTGR